MTLGVLGSYATDGNRTQNGRAGELGRAGVPIVWDSGAFSVFTGNATIDVDDHSAWVIREDVGDKQIRFVGLDVIGDGAATLANYRRQRQAGAFVEPTLHYGDPLEQVNKLVACGDIDWFNIGGLVPVLRNPAQRRNIAAFIASVRKRLPPEVKVHALGCVHPEVIRLVPIDAADSTYWFSLARFRTLALFNERRGNWRKFGVCTTTSHHPSRTSTWAKAYKRGQFLRDDYGLEPSDLTVNPIDDDKLIAASIEAHRRLARWAAAMHGLDDVILYLAGGIDGRVAVPELLRSNA